jgi:hypothetical protein
MIDMIKPNEQEKKAADMGMIRSYAYHCNRCNYVWFPKDYDYRPTSPILEMTPPKSCARCKSRSWNQIPEDENYCENSLARQRALERAEKQSPNYDPRAQAQEDRYLKRSGKQFADDAEELDRRTTKYIIKRFMKERLKKDRESSQTTNLTN